MAKVFIPRERHAGETRVAATPETVGKLVKLGHSVTVEAGAGEASFFLDEDYEAAGASLTTDVAASAGAADVVLTVVMPEAGGEVAGALSSGSSLIGLLAPHRNAAELASLGQRGVSTLSMELLPRITRAQSMDVLSSQASIGGYKAVLIVASRLPKYFPLLMTAAGTVRPARMVVMGAGVAGLQAVATAKRLGAVIEVSDIRPAVKEEVASLGGRFIELPELESGEGSGGYAKQVTPEFLAKQREIVTRHVADAHCVITTAQVPGRKAPILLTEEMVEGMKPGSVVVDMAAAEGGNCALSKPDEEVVHGGVTILAPTNLPATMPKDASLLYARNLETLMGHLTGEEGALSLDPEDEITGALLVTHGGEVVHAPTAERLAAAGGNG